jgi:hypothetical protein
MWRCGTRTQVSVSVSWSQRVTPQLWLCRPSLLQAHKSWWAPQRLLSGIVNNSYKVCTMATVTSLWCHCFVTVVFMYNQAHPGHGSYVNYFRWYKVNWRHCRENTCGKIWEKLSFVCNFRNIWKTYFTQILVLLICAFLIHQLFWWNLILFTREAMKMYKQAQRVNVHPGGCPLRDSSRLYIYSLIVLVYFSRLTNKQKPILSEQ